MPSREADVERVEGALSEGLPQFAILMAEMRIPRPVIATTARSIDQRVERSDVSLVTSERITRSCVTRGARGGAVGAA